MFCTSNARSSCWRWMNRSTRCRCGFGRCRMRKLRQRPQRVRPKSWRRHINQPRMRICKGCAASWRCWSRITARQNRSTSGCCVRSCRLSNSSRQPWRPQSAGCDSFGSRYGLATDRRLDSRTSGTCSPDKCQTWLRARCWATRRRWAIWFPRRINIWPSHVRCMWTGESMGWISPKQADR